MSKAIDELKQRLASFDGTGECERSNYSAVASDAIAHAEELEAESVLLRPRNVVAAVIRDANGKYLIGQRRPEQWMGGRWCFVGGKVEDGESLLDATFREVNEELGVDVAVGELIHEQIERYENGTWHLHYFDCVLVDGHIPAAIECQAFAFCHPHELVKYDLLPVDIDIAKRLRLETLVRELAEELGSYHGGYPEFSDACKVCSLIARAKEVAGE